MALSCMCLMVPACRLWGLCSGCVPQCTLPLVYLPIINFSEHSVCSSSWEHPFSLKATLEKGTMGCSAGIEYKGSFLKDGREDKSHQVCSLAQGMQRSYMGQLQQQWKQWGTSGHWVHVLSSFQFYLPTTPWFHSSARTKHQERDSANSFSDPTLSTGFKQLYNACSSLLFHLTHHLDQTPDMENLQEGITYFRWWLQRTQFIVSGKAWEYRTIHNIMSRKGRKLGEGSQRQVIVPQTSP